MKLWPFSSRVEPAPTPADAARALGELARAAREERHLSYRNRVRAKAKEMTEQLGRPPCPYFEPR